MVVKSKKIGKRRKEVKTHVLTRSAKNNEFAAEDVPACYEKRRAVNATMKMCVRDVNGPTGFDPPRRHNADCVGIDLQRTSFISSADFSYNWISSCC